MRHRRGRAAATHSRQGRANAAQVCVSRLRPTTEDSPGRTLRTARAQRPTLRRPRRAHLQSSLVTEKLTAAREPWPRPCWGVTESWLAFLAVPVNGPLRPALT